MKVLNILVEFQMILLIKKYYINRRNPIPVLILTILNVITIVI